MKSKLIWVIFGLIFSVQSLESIADGKGCVENNNNKCCQFAETDGVVTCEPPSIESQTTEIPTDSSESDRKEVVEEQVVVLRPASISFTINSGHICRKGFRLDSLGKCRRILGPTIERPSESLQQE